MFMARHIVSGGFSWLETGTSNVVVQGPGLSIAIAGGKRHCSGVEKCKSKIKNGSSKN